jgi:hypothetical protein
MTAWTCTACHAHNALTGKFCEQCGEARAELVPAAAPPPRFIPPWERPDFKPSMPSDHCDVEGCTLTVREHMAEFARIASQPGTVFTREPVIVTEHERKVREQVSDQSDALGLAYQSRKPTSALVRK